jgi:hypothetical protein
MRNSGLSIVNDHPLSGWLEIVRRFMAVISLR